MLQDEEFQKIARNRPRDVDSLGKLLSSDPIEAYGDRVLEITQAHKRDQTKFEECILERGAFVRGALPGMVCLIRVSGHEDGMSYIECTCGMKHAFSQSWCTCA